jgi:hypothetical protein
MIFSLGHGLVSAGFGGDPTGRPSGRLGNRRAGGGTSNRDLPCLLRRGIRPPEDLHPAAKRLRYYDDTVVEAGSLGFSPSPQKQDMEPDDLLAPMSQGRGNLINSE